ncbi:permease [Amycolatopsis sp. PS_44_ISF1]|uniref:permease n=1 Tax=Amycolatopsis sp. PS_44_ISF1 TaxID=2974917 RepID=UPI0028DDEAD6|nr:permease [Amycolatopsis sp. PS_44_ISF1]MDT8914633.1 permease [Amycolatopsis sp. PS_44_ISF1]
METLSRTTTEEPRRTRRFRISSIEILCAVLLVAILAQGWLQNAFDVPALRTGSTVFVAVCVQALPFLVLGVLISGAIAAFVPARVLERVLPKKAGAAVGVAGLAGVALPGCECASVPVARRLIGQGVAPAAALTFLLAAPAVNPVVLVATAVAFPGRPEMVLARFAGSLATAMTMGWIWARWGKLSWITERALRRLPDVAPGQRWKVFAETARTDLVEAGGFLVLGALISSTLNVLVPEKWFGVLSDQVVVGVLVMAVLAVVLALCSEADAFVAASLTAVPMLPKLVFLVVGPAIDVKLFALQAGTFGRSFAARFAPVTFVVALACGSVAGLLVLGGAR